MHAITFGPNDECAITCREGSLNFHRDWRNKPFAVDGCIWPEAWDMVESMGGFQYTLKYLENLKSNGNPQDFSSLKAKNQELEKKIAELEIKVGIYEKLSETGWPQITPTFSPQYGIWTSSTWEKTKKK